MHWPDHPWAGGGDDFVYLSQLEGEPVGVIIAPDARPLTVVEALSLRDALAAAVEMTQEVV